MTDDTKQQEFEPDSKAMQRTSRIGFIATSNRSLRLLQTPPDRIDDQIATKKGLAMPIEVTQKSRAHLGVHWENQKAIRLNRGIAF